MPDYDISTLPSLRRQDQAMPEAECEELLQSAAVGRIGTVGPDGWPYVLPVSFAVVGGRILIHHVRTEGHLNKNLANGARACFEVDEDGPVIALSTTTSQTTVLYRSVIVYGKVERIEDASQIKEALHALLCKYASHLPDRPLPKGAENGVAVYALTPLRMTGKARRP